MLGQNYRGVYIRKRSNDFDMTTPTPTSLYRWPSTASENRQGAFGEGAMPHMEIRYAEVMLNYAEAACAIGKPAEAIQVLKDIRARAGYDAAIAGPDYGLDVAALTANRGKLFGAILYERQIEFAYEGKRFDDMRRWLLWDGGANFSQVNGAPSSWTLSGFGGNTCTYLGVDPFNGKRRDNIELRTIALATETNGSDPISANRPVAPGIGHPCLARDAQSTRSRTRPPLAQSLPGCMNGCTTGHLSRCRACATEPTALRGFPALPCSSHRLAGSSTAIRPRACFPYPFLRDHPLVLTAGCVT
jgi:hypothetical protein